MLLKVWILILNFPDLAESPGLETHGQAPSGEVKPPGQPLSWGPIYQPEGGRGPTMGMKNSSTFSKPPNICSSGSGQVRFPSIRSIKARERLKLDPQIHAPCSSQGESDLNHQLPAWVWGKIFQSWQPVPTGVRLESGTFDHPGFGPASKQPFSGLDAARTSAGAQSGWRKS